MQIIWICIVGAKQHHERCSRECRRGSYRCIARCEALSTQGFYSIDRGWVGVRHGEAHRWVGLFTRVRRLRRAKSALALWDFAGRYSSRAGAADADSVLAAASFEASSPSISGEHPKSGIPSRRKVRRSSIPRESANVNPCRLRHTWSEALAVATICRASSTHAPSNFPSRPMNTSVIGTG
jgi:hypothetical protein